MQGNVFFVIQAPNKQGDGKNFATCFFKWEQKCGQNWNKSNEYHGIPKKLVP